MEVEEKTSFQLLSFTQDNCIKEHRELSDQNLKVHCLGLSLSFIIFLTSWYCNTATPSPKQPPLITSYQSLPSSCSGLSRSAFILKENPSSLNNPNNWLTQNNIIFRSVFRKQTFNLLNMLKLFYSEGFSFSLFTFPFCHHHLPFFFFFTSLTEAFINTVTCIYLFI